MKFKYDRDAVERTVVHVPIFDGCEECKRLVAQMNEHWLEHRRSDDDDAG